MLLVVALFKTCSSEIEVCGFSKFYLFIEEWKTRPSSLSSHSITCWFGIPPIKSHPRLSHCHEESTCCISIFQTATTFTDLSFNYWHPSLQVSLITFIPVSLRSQPQSWHQLGRGFSLNSLKYSRRFDGIKLLPVIRESQNCLGWKGS